MISHRYNSVYTFGPTFRAENSQTPRHLAEFWMIEPEIAFCDLQGDMACAEQYVQFCLRAVLDECAGDLAFLRVCAGSFSRCCFTNPVKPRIVMTRRW